MKLLITIIAIALIPLGFSLCDLFYLEDINSFAIDNPDIPISENPFHTKWWRLRMDLMALSSGLLIFSHCLKTKYSHEKIYGFVIYVGVSLSVSDIVDRWFLNIRVVTCTDLILTAVALVIGYYKFIATRIKTKG